MLEEAVSRRILEDITKQPVKIYEVVISEQDWGGGGVKGCTYVLTLGIAYFGPISEDVPKKESENNGPVILS